jgi:hypothetical protein
MLEFIEAIALFAVTLPEAIALFAVTLPEAIALSALNRSYCIVCL